MNRIIFTLLSLLLPAISFSQSFSWAKGMGGSVGDDAVRGSYVDVSGNVYLTGIFFNTIDFVTGGGANFTSVGGGDVFVVKYDATGNYAWARTFGGTGTGAASTLDDYGYAIQSDALGNVYVTGFFQNTVDFNPANPNTSVLTSQGLGDMFIVKYDASGTFMWVKQVGGVNQQIGYGLRLDANGNIFVSGAFVGAADFNPDPLATATLTGYSTGYDAFLAKYDNSGGYLWAYKFGSTSVNNADNFWGVDVDGQGNVYAIGYFAGTIDFNPSAATANVATVSATLDVVVAKYDNNGNYVWAKNMGGTGAEYGRSIRVDSSGHFYITGYFAGTVDFNPAAATNNLVSAGLNDIFLAKYDTAGVYNWAKKMGGTGNDHGWQLDIDNGNGIYLTGYFLSATANFNPAGTANLVNPGGGATGSPTSDGFLAKYDTSGAYMWAERIGSAISENDYGYAVNMNPVSGSIYLGGAFSGTTDFDFGATSATITSNGGTDAFIAVYGQTNFPLSVNMSALKGAWLNNNAVLSWSTFSERNNEGFYVEYATEGKTFHRAGFVPGTTTSATGQKYSFTHEAGAANNYYRVVAMDKNGKATTSNTVLLHRAVKSEAQYALFPNPATGQLTVTAETDFDDQSTVTILNIMGQPVSIQCCRPGRNTLDINIGDLPNGNYFIRLLHSGRETTLRFVKG